MKTIESEVRAEIDRLLAIRRLAASGEARRIREQVGLTVPEMAQLIGTDHSTVSKWERGLVRPRRLWALRWLDELERLQEVARAAV